jgi:hypothetical protein
LKGILGLILVVEDLTADAKHHRPVPLHQGRECGLGGHPAFRPESLQQLGIRQPDHRPHAKERADSVVPNTSGYFNHGTGSQRSPH